LSLLTQSRRPSSAVPEPKNFEIIPQSDPFKLKPGKKLAVKAVFGDKPLAVIAVDNKTPPTHPDLSDHDDYSAPLVFVIPE
jgi:uncharacterized GH25 family protein